jgi:hypothetical protein
MNTVQWLNKCSCTAAKIKVQINSKTNWNSDNFSMIWTVNTLQCTVQFDLVVGGSTGVMKNKHTVKSRACLRWDTISFSPRNIYLTIVQRRLIAKGGIKKVITILGMLLPDFREPDLSHASILYYYNIIENKNIWKLYKWKTFLQRLTNRAIAIAVLQAYCESKLKIKIPHGFNPLQCSWDENITSPI